MALTVNITYRDRDGQMLRTFADITFDSNHAAGGESLTPADLGFGRLIREIRVSGQNNGYLIVYNYATEKLTVYRQSAATGAFDEADTIDLSALTCKVVAIGY